MRLIQELRRQKRTGVGFLAAGILAIVIGGFAYANARSFYASAIHAPGKIVQLDRQKDGKETAIYPVFSFVDQAGVTHVIRSRRGLTRSSTLVTGEYAVGDAVEVLYPAGDPESARLKDFFSMWGWPVIFGGGGLVLALVGLVLWLGAVSRAKYEAARSTVKP